MLSIPSAAALLMLPPLPLLAISAGYCPSGKVLFKALLGFVSCLRKLFDFSLWLLMIFFKDAYVWN
jgi:hypothetical protein